MATTQPDERQVRLAEEYESEWKPATVDSCSSEAITLRIGEQTATYGISADRPPFVSGAPVELCNDWGLIRHNELYIVCFAGSESDDYPYGLDPGLPSEARDWSAVARAGWLYGLQNWLWGEDWIDVAFQDLDEGDDFEDWAHQSYIQQHEQDEMDDDVDEEGHDDNE